MGKNYDLYSPYQRTIDNLKRRIRGYEKMKKDLTNQYRKSNKENQELKKQLEEINNFISKAGFVNILQLMLDYCAKVQQQKEFIEYMNKTIEECNNYSKYIEKKTKELHGRSCGKTYIANEIMKNEVAKKILEEILSKYKEIIGDDK